MRIDTLCVPNPFFFIALLSNELDIRPPNLPARQKESRIFVMQK